MQRDREQFWLIAACVIAAHAAALAVTTVGWALWASRVVPPPASVEVAIAKPVMLLKEVPPPDENALGEADGAGKSIATVDAPQPTVSDKPDEIEQAWTRKKPAPLPSQVTQQSEAEPQAQSSLGPQSVTAMSPLAIRQSPAKRDDPREETPRDAPPLEAAKPAEAVEKQTEQVKASTEPPDPAVTGKSDLDPFADEEGVSFTPGGTAARKGREVKLSRPRIDLGFMAEATRISGRDLIVRMQIETDAVGHPSHVTVLDSSGSDLIDDAVRLAMYDSWFGGKMPDRFAFTVRFVRR